MARRRDGWSFLLADVEDVQRLNRLTLDGETVLAQMAGELVDVSALSWASEVADALAPQIAQFHHLLELTGAEKVGASGYLLTCWKTSRLPANGKRVKHPGFNNMKQVHHQKCVMPYYEV